MKEWLRHMARIYMPVHLCESDKMKIIYAGYSPIKKSYYARLLLNSNFQFTYLGRYWFSGIPNLISSLNLDMIISEISRVTFTHFQNCNGYILPVWTTTRIDIDRPIGEICNSNSTDYPNVKRRIRKYDLTYDILTDNKSFNDFNDKFYLPYITKRHGDEAFIEDLKPIWKSSRGGFLMAIRENGNIVGMSLLVKSGDIIYLKRLGLLDGNDKYRRHGVIGAFYYFGIIEGHKMGCKSLDLGGTRPFLTDGLTKYKLGLGAEFVSNLSPSKEYLWYGVNEKSSAAKEFLSNNPFMHLNRDFKLVRFGS